jgi:hypothetical protein
MSSAAVHMGVGTRVHCDGEIMEIVEMHSGPTGSAAVLKSSRTQHLLTIAVSELVPGGPHARVLPDNAGPSSDDPFATAGVVLSNLTEPERQAVLERAAHYLTGIR